MVENTPHRIRLTAEAHAEMSHLSEEMRARAQIEIRTLAQQPTETLTSIVDATEAVPPVYRQNYPGFRILYQTLQPQNVLKIVSVLEEPGSTTPREAALRSTAAKQRSGRVERAPAAPAVQKTRGDSTKEAPIVRARVLETERAAGQRRRSELIARLKVGEWYEGKVTGVATAGAFVDLGGIDGLIHLSELRRSARGETGRAEDLLHVGQVVRVRVTEIDAERGRVHLSMREPYRTASAREGVREHRARQDRNVVRFGYSTPSDQEESEVQG